MFTEVVLTQPTVEPVSLAEMRAHCRIDHTEEDETLAAYIAAARSWCEDYCRRSFITQTLRQRRECFSPTPFDRYWYEGVLRGYPFRMYLPNGPVQSVTSIVYDDQDDASQTLATSVYEVVLDPTMAYVALKSGQTWPSTNDESAPVTITYVAGYGSTSADVPAPIRHAVKMLAGQFYEFREPIVAGTIVSQVPMAVEALLSPHRVLGGYQ